MIHNTYSCFKTTEFYAKLNFNGIFLMEFRQPLCTLVGIVYCILNYLFVLVIGD